MNHLYTTLLGGICLFNSSSACSQSLNANAGLDQQLQLPYNYTDIYGGYSKAGTSTIATYDWKQVSGPGTAMVDSAKSVTGICHVTSLNTGVYQFELTVTDKAGQSSRDTMAITVTACNYNPNRPKVIIYPASGSVSQIYLPVNAQSVFNAMPGDTIKIDASRIQGSTLSTFELGNLHGCPGQPITISNINGQVVTSKMVLGSDDTTRLRLGDTYLNYVNILGNGSSGIPYGFKVLNGALSVNLSSNLRLSGFEVSGGSVGFYVKVNNQNAGRFTEKKSYPNWWIRDIEIDHSTVHEVGGEGMYLGHTDPTAANNCPGCTLAVQGDSILVHDNTVQNTQYDGIQVSAFNHAAIYNNTITRYGLANVNTQRTGIILGRLTRGSISRNVIKAGPGSGIQIFGYDSIRVDANTLDSVGYAAKENALFANNLSNSPFPTSPGQLILFTNNTVRYYNADSTARALFLGNYLPGAAPATVNNNRWCFGANTPANWLTTKIVANAPGLSQSNNILDCSGLPSTMSNRNTPASEFPGNMSLRAYPNPAAGMVQVIVDGQQMGSGVLIVYDLTGRVRKQWNFQKSAATYALQADLSGLGSGVYFFKTTMGESSSLIKIIKQQP